MFLITDPTDKFTFRCACNDVDTAADIILGITEVDEDYWRALGIMEGMKFNESYLGNGFIIECVTEERYSGMLKTNPKRTDMKGELNGNNIRRNH